MQRGGDRDRGTDGRPKRDPVGVAKCEPECEPEHFSLGVAERKSEHVAQLRADRHADSASHGGAIGRALRVADGNDEGANQRGHSHAAAVRIADREPNGGAQLRTDKHALAAAFREPEHVPQCGIGLVERRVLADL